MQKQKTFTDKTWDVGDTVIIGSRQYKILRFHRTLEKVHLEFISDDNEKVQEWKSISDLPPYPTPQPEPPTKKTEPPAQKPGGIPTFEVGHMRKSYAGTGPSLEVIKVLPDGKYECEVTVTGGNKYKHVFDGKRVSTWGNAVVETPPSTGPGPDALRLHEATSQKPKNGVAPIPSPLDDEVYNMTPEAQAELKKVAKTDDKEETQEVEVVKPKTMQEVKYKREIRFAKYAIHDTKGWHEEEADKFFTDLVNNGWRESHIQYQPIGTTLFVIWTLTKVEKITS